MFNFQSETGYVTFVAVIDDLQLDEMLIDTKHSWLLSHPPKPHTEPGQPAQWRPRN